MLPGIYKHASNIQVINTKYLHEFSTQALQLKKIILYHVQQFTTHRTQCATVLDHDSPSSIQFSATSPVFTATTRPGLDVDTTEPKDVAVSSPVRNTASSKPTHNDSSPEHDTDSTNPRVNASLNRYGRR
jgi:hypothetical protein